jgi:hypothetical protein
MSARRSRPQPAASRRRFIAGATAAVAAPYVITSKALGDATTPPASDRIVIAGIGLGNQGSADAGGFKKLPDVAYVAQCDVKWKADPAKGQYQDFRELLARDDIDAVHIGTPDHWHAVMMIAACRAGKDVYLQKPETLVLAEGGPMVAAARRYGRVVSGGSQRVLEDYRGLVVPFWSGAQGAVKEIHVDLGPPAMPCYLPAAELPADFNWDLWLGPAPWQPYHPGRRDGNFGTAGNSWRSYIDYSGGSMTDWGAHHMGGALFAADMRDLQPERATFHPAADGKSHVTLSYGNGVEVQCKPGSGRPRLIGHGEPRAAKPVPRYQGAGSIYGDFIESVKTRQRPFRDIEFAVNTMVALHVQGLAMRLRKSLTWDRAAQRFKDDDEANRLLDRARREPWTL